MWWTNEQARAQAVEQVRDLEREWGRSPGSAGAAGSAVSPESGGSSESGGFPESSGDSVGESAGESAGVGTSVGPGGGSSGGGSSDGGSSAAYAVLRIPRLGLTVPVADGVGKRSVLDRGFVGHYPGTAGPGRAGNFALAGHRNTHGEPFRYVNRLRKGDVIDVRTRSGSYTYRVDLVLPQTSPRDVGVIAPVPRSLFKRSYGYDDPGSYLTLTTCTPEFTSTYRLIVWAKLVPGGPRATA
ncbi:class E sortase [Streptomyces sp. NPDC046374]|uniref:class E sortase n=1 Tax=Streptomyces sp. NPDC046374 TaxID=3154917 RepID=UPI0033EE0E38